MSELVQLPGGEYLRLSSVTSVEVGVSGKENPWSGNEVIVRFETPNRSKHITVVRFGSNQDAKAFRDGLQLRVDEAKARRFSLQLLNGASIDPATVVSIRLSDNDFKTLTKGRFNHVVVVCMEEAFVYNTIAFGSPEGAAIYRNELVGRVNGMSRKEDENA